MDSFASQKRTYSDGQENVIPVPDEVQQYGFRPPVRAANGELIKGDKLNANHLNFILNDIYNRLGNTGEVSEYQGDATRGYIRYKNGNIECWGRGGAALSTTGVSSTEFPLRMPAAPQSIVITQLGTDSQNGVDFTSLIESTKSDTGFSAKTQRVTASSVSAGTGAFIYTAKYFAGKVS